MHHHHPTRPHGYAVSTMQHPLVSLLAKVLLLASATLHPAIASAAPVASSVDVTSAMPAAQATKVLPTICNPGSARA